MADDERKELISLAMKVVNGLVALVATGGIALGGFALKSNYEAQLSLRELSVRITSAEESGKDNQRLLATHASTLHRLELDGQGRKSDLAAIKDDISEIKDLLKQHR